MSRETVSVLVPVPVDEPFDYAVPDGAAVPPPGSFVRVPFGRQEQVGVVWHRPGSSRVPLERLKPLLQVLDAAPMPEPVRALVEEVARETLAPLGSSLRLALPVPAALEPWPEKLGYRRAPGLDVTAVKGKRAQAVAALPEGEAVLAKALAERAGVGVGVLHGMAKAGLLEPVGLVEVDVPSLPDPDALGVTLTPDQARVAAGLVEAVAERRPEVVLLEGVPGAGKTEVYFEAVAEALRGGRRVLVLLPEIVLSAQWLARFERRFGVQPAAWHSALTPAQRRDTWRLIAEGRIPVVVGARSALFLPLDRARPPRRRRGARHELQAGRGGALQRPRHGAGPRPLRGLPGDPRHRHAIDRDRIGCGRHRRRAQGPARLAAHAPALAPRRGRDAGRSASSTSAGAAAPRRLHLPAAAPGAVETLAAEGQSLLFINRRGYAPLTLCRACGYRLACSNCSAWLVAHRLRGRLQCHHCGLTIPAPEHCPSCGSVGTLVASGPGSSGWPRRWRTSSPTPASW